MAEDRSTSTGGVKQRTASVRGKKGEWECKLCQETFKDDKAEVMECEYCDEHFCRKCLNMTAADYKVLSKRRDIHWYCPPCEAKAMKNLKTDKEVEERCREYFEKLESCLSNLEKKVDKKPDRSEVTQMIKDSEKISNLEKKVDEKPDRSEVTQMIKDSEKKQEAEEPKITEETMEQKIHDLSDSEARKNNIIIHGLEESESSDGETSRKDDARMIEELCESLGMNPATVDDLVRLGKKPEAAVQAAEGDTEEIAAAKPNLKPRPTKVMFQNKLAKDNFMKSLRKLPDAGEKFKAISVMHDMTTAERELNKKKIQEAKKLNKKEKSKNHKHIAVGPPWDRKVLRVEKKKS